MKIISTFLSMAIISISILIVVENSQEKFDIEIDKISNVYLLDKSQLINIRGGGSCGPTTYGYVPKNCGEEEKEGYCKGYTVWYPVDYCGTGPSPWNRCDMSGTLSNCCLAGDILYSRNKAFCWYVYEG